IDRHFSEQAHFYMEGGAGARGYKNASVVPEGGGGISGELLIPNPLASMGWLPASVKPLLFGDAAYGRIAYSDGSYYEDIVVDAGIGLRLDLLSWLPWQLQGVAEEYASIPKIGIYFPFFLSKPDDGMENFGFRYVISLGTTF
ncbi:MAG TPA: hypothetical protein VIX80_06975, partial [Candidatus Kapabacteria bacterium]